MQYPSLIDFWRIQRGELRQSCFVQPFHEEIADKLTKLIQGSLDKPNLMINMPPRCAKTDLCVKAFVPWALSYFPDSEFILSSYASDLATDNSVNIRDTLSSYWYRSIISSDWGAKVDMSGDKAGGRKDHFFTQQGGVVKGVGRGAGITGFGAGKLRPEFGGAIIIDDLLKAQEANSAASRKEAVNYMSGTLYSRRNRQETPQTPMILIMQRLHPEDPAGYLLREEREDWHVLQIPAHEGTNVIWPGRLNYDNLMKLQDTDPDTYWSQYMQNPQQSSSIIFKESWWKYWNDLSKIESQITLKFITADTAFKAKEANDWSVMQVWGCIGTKGIVLLDQIRERVEFPALINCSKQIWNKHKQTRYLNGKGTTPVTEFWIEDKASGTSLVQTLRHDGQIPAREWLPTDKASPDKVGRAKQCTMAISSGRVFLPNPNLPGYGWVRGFVNEHSSFSVDDSHLFDDQGDAETMAIMIWQQRGGSVGPIPEVN